MDSAVAAPGSEPSLGGAELGGRVQGGSADAHRTGLEVDGIDFPRFLPKQVFSPGTPAQWIMKRAKKRLSCFFVCLCD